ncbi:MAG: prolyl oligopeptidase family serine peptidase [Planctomycetes bacterium]|nr:prolyl oligopeptidase family serine peptidase [Planctomycetota bacterium]
MLNCSNDAMKIQYALPLVLVLAAAACALEPIPPITRILPPPGIQLPAPERDALAADLAKTEARLKGMDEPDVEIFTKAVRLALICDEFYSPKDIAKAQQCLTMANERLDALAKGQRPWETQRGFVVRGYRSNIDGSAQPYGLEIPETLDLAKPVPLYVWLHGRGDKNTDIYFINDRLHSHAPISPYTQQGIIVHPFGRQCVGYKSAGEIDVLDAIKSVESRYKIDENRVALTGFSMGGAGAWHLGAHYADHFCVVHAGAGFVDVQRYQNVDPATVPPYEVKLWGMYDVPDYVRNLFNVPTIAYSGEIDKQKASADIMEEAFKAEGHTLPRVIGPKMGHKYAPESLKEVMAFVNEAVKKGRDLHPGEVHLQTRTLRYDSMRPFSLYLLQSHWDDARLDAIRDASGVWKVTTKNIRSFYVPVEKPGPLHVVIDGQTLQGQEFNTDPNDLQISGIRAAKINGSWTFDDVFVPTKEQLVLGSSRLKFPLQKAPGLQGPIDDAFMAPFLVVAPSGSSGDARFDQWASFELDHLKTRWQALFRGDLRIKMDTDVTDDDIQKYHLVAFGDEKSNKLIARLADKLPMKPRDGEHVNLLIYPNPLNAEKYIVLNSGPTFREAHDRTNSLQNPKLGDWAVIDITTPPNAETPGKVLEAGFFDEQWQPTK